MTYVQLQVHSLILSHLPGEQCASAMLLKPQRGYCKLKNVTTTTVSRPFFRDHLGEPVPEENFWTLWCKGRLTEADTLTIRLGATPSGLTSAPHIFLRAGCPSCHPTNSVKALKQVVHLD